MRTRKALMNASINIISYFIAFLPNLIVRKVFLDNLGNEMLGLNSLYTNIIGWLSIIEMGVGSAIVYSLYKPYAENDQKTIRAYIRFYGEVYRKIGIFIFILGILIIPLLKYFIKDGINLAIVNIGFLLFLCNSFVTYLFSHKLCILNVAQEAYKLTIGTTLTKFLIAIFQVLMFKIKPSFILFIVIQLIINCIYLLIINVYIDLKYKWLSLGKEKLNYNVKIELLKNIKAMFMHKIGALVVNSTDNILISSFVGLKTLANYTNYEIIITAMRLVVVNGLSGLTASIGNMLASDNKEQAYIIHRRIFFLSFWIVSLIIISLNNILNQFIAIWVGKEYLLDRFTFIIILINVYFGTMRGSVEQFQSASGQFYQDRYAAIAEAIINLVFSLILVKYIGIAGVFLGTLISNITVLFWTKPYVVYKYVFNKSIKEYFKLYFNYLFIAIIPLIITNLLTQSIKFKYDFKNLIVNIIINIIVINVIYVVIFFKTEEFRYYKNLIKNIILKNI